MEGNFLIVTPGGEKGTLAAIDKYTGRMVWQSKAVTYPASFASPIAATIKGVRQIINSTAGVLISVDRDGNFLWEYKEPAQKNSAATPIVHQDLVFASSHYKVGSGVARISKEGNVFKVTPLWFEKKFQNHHGGVIRVGDYLYGFGDKLTCLDMKTGYIVWSNPSVGKGSLVYAEGHLYCLGEKNVVGLVEATSAGYKEKGRFEIPKTDRPSWSHPVVIRKRLFIRDQDTLTCWDIKSR